MKKRIINIINEVAKNNMSSESNDEHTLLLSFLENISECDYDKDLLDFGIDSIIFIQIIVALEDDFSVQIPDEKLLLTEINTINKIYNTIKTLV